MTDDARTPLHGEAYFRDPYPVFAALRARGPVRPVEFPAVGAWLVTGYDAAVDALNDPRLGKAHSRGNEEWRVRASIMPEPQHSQLQVHLLHQDPPRHTELRTLVADAFTPRRTEALRPAVAAHVRALIDALPARGPVDLMEAFASRLPLLVLADAIGLPAELAARFDPAWGGVVAPVGPGDPRRAAYESLLAGLQGFIGEVVDAFPPAGEGAARREGLLARLVDTWRDGRQTRAELDSLIFQLLAAGQDPVTNQLCMSLVALFREPGALAWLRAHPEGIDRAVEELLRYESAFKLTTWRFFVEDTRVGDTDSDGRARWSGEATEPLVDRSAGTAPNPGVTTSAGTCPVTGVTVPAGDSVIVALADANRDPARFAEPDRLVLDRSPNPHLAFGHGIHFCPGAPLARVQLQESLRALLRRLPGLSPAYGSEDELEFQRAALTRGVIHLPVDYHEVHE